MTGTPWKRADLWTYFALACAITWGLDAPVALAWARHEEAPPWGMGLVGLGAFGPTLAAVVVAWRRKAIRSVFGGWRAQPGWVIGALFLPAALLLVATVAEFALGGQPRWWYPPERPEHVVALFFFSFGEEFGWRGFAQKQAASQLGRVVGPLVVGAVWGLWHLGMMFTPGAGAPGAFKIGETMLELALYSLIFQWIFERTNRSILVAIAFHAGGHLDNSSHIAATETRFLAVRVVVLAIAAGFAARALLAKRAERAVVATQDG